MDTIEAKLIDLKYKSYRLCDRNAEKMLLSSISERGVLEPLRGVKEGHNFILLDGFKRLRCGQKLHIDIFPYSCIGSDEADGIFQMLRESLSKNLHILEQARLVDELKRKYGLSTTDIATKVERSLGWVSMRFGLLSELSPFVQGQIFSGRFPIYSFMYTLRHFMRMKKVTKSEIDKFVQAVGGKKLSTRQIDLLARGYFQGGSGLRDQILNGNLNWCLEKLNQINNSSESYNPELNEPERSLIRDLEIGQKYMRRIQFKILNSKDFQNPSFFAEAGLLASGVLSQLNSYQETIRSFYDRCTQTSNNLATLSRRGEQEKDCSTSQSKH
jgi:hypothetical protein